MTVHARYAAANKRLLNGEKLFIDGSSARADRISHHRTQDSRPMRYPRIGIYAGAGSSHSWLWFVDMFDCMGFHDIVLLDDASIRQEGVGDIDVLTVSGGDTFAVAKALGPSGARHLKEFIGAGGIYIGSCAGAYLVMNSSKPHLSDFNFTGVKITNLSKFLPTCCHLPHKFAMAYGCDYIFHPVRETVMLKTTGNPPFVEGQKLDAPLYGGPGMIAPQEAQVLAWYHDFTPNTVFLVEQELARKTLLGKAAALRAPLGEGWLYLCGPHFEHPRFPATNAWLADAIFWDNQRCQAPRHLDSGSRLCSDIDGRNLLKDIKREVSNARICASGLEMQPIRWLIGAKYYEPEKIRVFLEAIWRRLAPLEKRGRLYASQESGVRLRRYAEETTALVRHLKHSAEQACETYDLAEKLFGLLQRFAITFLKMYFKSICEPTPNFRS
jgi:hypothetical protein